MARGQGAKTKTGSRLTENDTTTSRIADSGFDESKSTLSSANQNLKQDPNVHAGTISAGDFTGSGSTNTTSSSGFADQNIAGTTGEHAGTS